LSATRVVISSPRLQCVRGTGRFRTLAPLIYPFAFETKLKAMSDEEKNKKRSR
jgi:hypothetical protein